MIDAPTDLHGNVIVVAGAGSGVGQATAITLAAAGARLVLLGRRDHALNDTAHLIGHLSGETVDPLPIPTDVTSEASVSAAISRTMSTTGRIDGLIYAAGVGLYGPVASYSLADWQTTLDTNLTGAFLCCRAVLEPMRAAGTGAIVAIASGAGKQGYAALSAYAASKFGLIGLMQSLAAEVGADGIKVSTIVPGSILTDFAGGSADDKREAAAQEPSKRYLEPKDVADAVVFLLRQPRRAWTQELNLWPA